MHERAIIALYVHVDTIQRQNPDYSTEDFDLHGFLLSGFIQTCFPVET